MRRLEVLLLFLSAGAYNSLRSGSSLVRHLSLQPYWWPLHAVYALVQCSVLHIVVLYFQLMILVFLGVQSMRRSDILEICLAKDFDKEDTEEGRPSCSSSSIRCSRFSNFGMAENTRTWFTWYNMGHVTCISIFN